MSQGQVLFPQPPNVIPELRTRLNGYANLSESQSYSSQSKTSSSIAPSSLFKHLLTLDFKEQSRLVRAVIQDHKIVGFLIHGESECGQQLLVTRLYRLIPEWQKCSPISINVSSNGIGSDIRKLWGRVADYLGMKRTSEPDRILEKICERYQNQSIIFIFSTVEYMMPAKTLNLWLQEFWERLVEKVQQSCYQNKNYLLMFLVDYCGKVCQSNLNLMRQSDTLNPLIPLCLPPTCAFSLEILEDWLNNVEIYEEISFPMSLTAQNLFYFSDKGIPQIVIEEICKHCNFSWEGDLAQWLI